MPAPKKKPAAARKPAAAKPKPKADEPTENPPGPGLGQTITEPEGTAAQRAPQTPAAKKAVKDATAALSDAVDDIVSRISTPHRPTVEAELDLAWTREREALIVAIIDRIEKRELP